MFDFLKYGWQCSIVLQPFWKQKYDYFYSHFSSRLQHSESIRSAFFSFSDQFQWKFVYSLSAYSQSSAMTSQLRQNLPRIHDVLRIQGLLDRVHQFHSILSQFLPQISPLSQSDSVFSSARSICRQGSSNESIRECLDLPMLRFVLFDGWQNDMEVSISHVSNYSSENLMFIKICPGLRDNIGKSRDRNADVRGEALQMRMKWSFWTRKLTLVPGLMASAA